MITTEKTDAGIISSLPYCRKPFAESELRQWKGEEVDESARFHREALGVCSELIEDAADEIDLLCLTDERGDIARRLSQLEQETERRVVLEEVASDGRQG